MPDWLQIALPLVVGVAALLVLLRLIGRAADRRLVAMLRSRYRPEDLLRATGANLMGQRSRVGGGVKGKGILALAPGELWFALAVPRRELTIPLEAIRSVSLPRSFMGRSVFRELLCIRFDGPDGEDEIAWAVREPRNWRQALESDRRSS